jgi:hypothetical protein
MPAYAGMTVVGLEPQAQFVKVFGAAFFKKLLFFPKPPS